MRRSSPRTVAIAAALLVLAGVTRLDAAAKATPDLNGPWKLVLLPFGEDEFAIVNLKHADGSLTADVVSAQEQIFGQAKDVKADAKLAGDLPSITFAPKDGPGSTFTGVTVTEKTGDTPARVLGTLHLGSSDYPARLEKTEDKEVARLKASPLNAKLQTAASEPNAKAKAELLAKLLDAYKDAPANTQFIRFLIPAAELAKVDEATLKTYIATWTNAARPYGPVWTAQVRSQILSALNGKKPYAKTALALAQDAAKDLPDDAPTELKAKAVGQLAMIARQVGDEKTADEADARSKVLEAQLDEEYHHKVPPYKPEPFAGRKDAKADRIVLMELFTGAQCPPCVAADVGFDGLLQTYKPTELVTLQYHLHIPGPDPLTNPDTVARQDYYKETLSGTPTTYFNGQDQAGGGGGMANAEAKYNQYRKIIDEALEGRRAASIDLTAKRTGDEIQIKASAEVNDPAKDAKPHLRLALVEESVRYVGGNKLRFHHRVVRALPGGAEGKALENGKVKVEQTVKLADLRKSLEAYLADYPEQPRARGPFPSALPPIELKNLSVVAFVQDDSDKSVLHAVSVSLDGPKGDQASR